MPWVVALHIIAMGTWFSTLISLPPLMVALVRTREPEEHDPLLLLASRLFTYAMTVSGLVTIASGTWLLVSHGFDGAWLPLKLLFVSLLVLFHLYWGALLAAIRDGSLSRSVGFLRLLPLAPAIAALAVIVLVSAKPF